jgi:hypothetical protein
LLRRSERFAAITGVGEYLARLRELTIPAAQAREPQLLSPFMLPAAIDYLDVGPGLGHVVRGTSVG